MLSSAIVLLYSNSSMITFTFYFDYFDLIIGSQGVVKIVQKILCILHPVSSSGYILHNYSTLSKSGN